MTGRPAVRPPRQARSREAWDRILAAGIDILTEQGRESLTIAAVCERAQVAPSAIYARVEGMTGFFWAIYDVRMAPVLDDEQRLLDVAATSPPGTLDRIAAVVHALAENFEQHREFLHPIIGYAVTDPELRLRGSQASVNVIDRMGDLLGGDKVAALEAARFVHQECIVRSLYGDAWLSREPESLAAFEARLTRMAAARLLHDTTCSADRAGCETHDSRLPSETEAT